MDMLAILVCLLVPLRYMLDLCPRPDIAPCCGYVGRGGIARCDDILCRCRMVHGGIEQSLRLLEDKVLRRSGVARLLLRRWVVVAVRCHCELHAPRQVVGAEMEWRNAVLHRGGLLDGLLDEELHRLVDVSVRRCCCGVGVHAVAVVVAAAIVGGGLRVQQHQGLLECCLRMFHLAIGDVDKAHVVPCHGESRRRQRVWIMKQDLEEQSAGHLEIPSQQADLRQTVLGLGEHDAERVFGDVLLIWLLRQMAVDHCWWCCCWRCWCKVMLLVLVLLVAMVGGGCRCLGGVPLRLLFFEVVGPVLEDLTGLVEDNFGVVDVAGLGSQTQHLPCGVQPLIRR